MKLTCLVLCLVQAQVLLAEEDIFAEFEEIPLEIDKNFEDDFADVELGSGAAPGSITSFEHEPFNVLGVIRREKSISLLTGSENIASVYHFTMFPQGRLETSKMLFHFGVPVRFPVYDAVEDGVHGIRTNGFQRGVSLVTPRLRDFRNWWDIQRVIRYIEIGHALDPFGVKLTRSHSTTFGHGELLKNISPEGFYDEDYLFLKGHARWKYVRVDGFMAPIVRAEMIGISTRFTPLVSIDAPAFIRNLNFDATYINDFKAYNSAEREGDAFVLGEDRRLIKRSFGMAQGAVFGVTGEQSAFSWLTLKPYMSSGHLWLSGVKHDTGDLPLSYGLGFHVGHDAVFNLAPSSKSSTLSVKTEGRIFSHGYAPSYFGSTYMLDRVRFDENRAAHQNPITKSQYVSGDPDHQFRFGYLVELGYAFSEVVAVHLGYENAHSFNQATQIDPLRKLHFLATVFGLERVKLSIGYQATAIKNMRDLFDFEGSRSLVSFRGQLKILPFLYFDSWAKHAFGVTDMHSAGEGESLWLTHAPETRSFNFGLGVELAMTF